MTVWFTSDPHFYHKNVIGFCNRPFDSVEQMNDMLINNWNETVAPEDEIIVLGDFAFCGALLLKELVPQLQGVKKIVLGNHDWKWKERRWLEFGFDEVIKPGPFDIGYERTVNLSHFPYKAETDVDDRYLDSRLDDDGKILLHGHVHCSYRTKKRMVNVGVDVWGYRPICLEEILEDLGETPK